MGRVGSLAMVMVRVRVGVRVRVRIRINLEEAIELKRVRRGGALGARRSD